MDSDKRLFSFRNWRWVVVSYGYCCILHSASMIVLLPILFPTMYQHSNQFKRTALDAVFFLAIGVYAGWKSKITIIFEPSIAVGGYLATIILLRPRLYPFSPISQLHEWPYFFAIIAWGMVAALIGATVGEWVKQRRTE